MEPLATYHEVRFEGSRTFTLLPDRIVIRGKQFLECEFDTSVALATLVPTPGRFLIRNASFNCGLWIAVVSFVTCSVLVSGFEIPFATFAPGLVACMGMAGVVLMLATFRKVEFARFKNDGGVTVLDIARAGRDAAQFDSFVDAVTKQISVARGVA